jgi:hypothetical protein
MLNPQGTETFLSMTSDEVVLDESAEEVADMVRAGYTVISIERADPARGFGGVPGLEVTIDWGASL